jgi:UDP-N-acetylmuramate--alanine ligase
MTSAGTMGPRLGTMLRRVHVMGAGGAGMSALASVLAAMGHAVSGCDLKSSPVLERLSLLGVEVRVGHDPSHVRGVDVVAYSSAVDPGHPELEAARDQGAQVWTRADLLEAIAADREVVAIAGTHGKTTTSSMLALVLVEGGVRPSFVVGGEVNEIGTNAVWDEGELLVVEADESDGTFLRLRPRLALVTSVEADHLDHWGSLSAVESAFDAFVGAAGLALVCADDDGARRLRERLEASGGTAPRILGYGLADEAEFRIEGLELARSEVRFRLSRPGGPPLALAAPVPGVHNARNAAGAAAAGLLLGARPEDVARALARFGGVARRFEFRGEVAGITFVDDYAHLPTEVRAALAAARAGGWRRVVAVFQPHRYTRTAALAADFGTAFDDADLVVVTDVYPAGEPARLGVSGKLVLDAVLEARPDTPAAYLPRRDELVAYLRRVLRPGDCCLTLNAGDLTSLPDELMELLG